MCSRKTNPQFGMPITSDILRFQLQLQHIFANKSTYASGSDHMTGTESCALRSLHTRDICYTARRANKSNRDDAALHVVWPTFRSYLAVKQHLAKVLVALGCHTFVTETRLRFTCFFLLRSQLPTKCARQQACSRWKNQACRRS